VNRAARMLTRKCSHTKLLTKENTMFAKIMKWGTLAGFVYMLVYFQGDIQRYVKMKRMPA
jgi:hypothetical protein